MDDMLIVRMSDRSRQRHARNRRATPAGANLGLVMGLALAIPMGFSQGSSDPMHILLGAGMGLVIGGLFGRFITRPRRPRPQSKVRHYRGMPFEEETEEDESPKEKTPTPAS